MLVVSVDDEKHVYCIANDLGQANRHERFDVKTERP